MDYVRSGRKGLPEWRSVRASKVLTAFLEAVEMYDLKDAKACAMRMLLKPPETFILTLTIRWSRSARLFVKGMLVS
jgi:hypothetical protein